ncbi:MAG: carbohydrate ABC transporter permease [Sinomonas sp.]|nr:carbohydrate ABC transporter permease [Sinomonas sp.]
MRWGRIPVHAIVLVLMVIWFTPVLGLFTSSFRTASDTASTGWWMAFVAPLFTGYNYQQAFAIAGVGGSMATSLAISIPVTVMTTLLSAVGAFALTTMSFRGRSILSLLLVALLVVPPQVTLVPMLQFFTAVGLSGTVPAVWIFQVGFTLPFGIFLVRGFIASIPEDVLEAAAIDGASALRIFRSVVLPLSLPILASLSIMQFLWSWNDLLVPLLFLGGTDLTQPMTVQIAGLVQETGQGQSLLLASTVVSTLLPLTILIGLQRYFVRGILGGAVKG